MKTIVATLALLFGGAVSGQAPSGGSAACERLAASLKLPNAVITSAQAVGAGQFSPPASPAGGGGAAQAFADLPAFCRVALTSKPTSDSDIQIEVWMPLADWNGKFQGVGNGGWAGSIQYGPLAAAVRRGYAAASTDTGHVGATANFAIGHPEKLIDFGYRAIHEMTVHAKAIVAGFYGSAARLAYFTGCSNGGRQGFMEAQRFPQDFDGIVAGAPANNWTSEMFKSVLIGQASLNDPASTIPPGKYAVLYRAALDACDARDGLKDGLIDDPTRCRFDPKIIECKGADAPTCLTSPQVEAARKIYAPSKNPRTGEEIFPGLEPGSEPLWAPHVAGPRPFSVADDLFKYVVFRDPNWDFRKLDPAADLERARKADNNTLTAADPNIRTFVSRGGKLVIYHGWADQLIGPRNAINYYAAGTRALGTQWDDAVRLYMVPGMAHCGGGEGPNTFDMLTALEQWKEKGIAPMQIVAAHLTNGNVDRTRPLCPYPQVARYKGTGSTDEATNFVCTMP